MSRRRYSVRFWLGSFAAIIALPLLVLLIWMFVAELRRQQDEARDSALRIAQATGARIRALHADSLGLLEEMTLRPGIRKAGGSCDPLFSIVDFFPQYVNLLLFDAHGNLLCSAAPQSAEDRQISEAAIPWIQSELRAGRLRPRQPLMRSIDSRWVATVMMPAGDNDLALVQLPEAIGLETLPAQSVMTIIDMDGRIVVRTREAAKWVGRSALGTQVAQLAIRIKNGRAEAVGVDGISREYGFTFVPETGWYIYIGVPVEALMRPVRNLFLRGLAAGIAVSLIVVALALLLSRVIERPINALSVAADAVAQGTYGQVTVVGPAPKEIANLAEAFNEMVVSRLGSERNLKALSDRLLAIQEDERARIARTIHDDLGQSVSALKMDVLGLIAKSGERTTIADRILTTLDTIVTSVQTIATELRPSVLDDLGLVPAIESEARLFEERTGIECDVSMPPQDSLPIDRSTATAMYRIVQEALTNVFRHSNATRVELRLRERGSELLLEVRDDGRGITGSEVDDPSSIGLIGIRERAQMIGGTAEFQGVPGRGTIVSIRVPAAAENRT